MAKELMEIGGFITEGAEIVNHDNSLSGNGTVDSPLGVVPGYNETVLWSGASTSTAFNLSEPITNFEYIMLSNNVLPAPAAVVKVEPSHSAKFGYARSWMSDDNTCHYRFYSVTSTDGKNFVNRYTRGIDYTTAMAESHGGGSNWHLENTMIVGINRKAQ